MAIKFFKVFDGLSKLFKTTDKQEDHTSITDSSNYTDSAIEKGVNDDSIAQITCTESDTKQFGAHYLPGTSVLQVNGVSHIDSKNIISGISMQVYGGIPVFITPLGMLKSTDEVKIGRIKRVSRAGASSSSASKGLTIPVIESVTLPDSEGNAVDYNTDIHLTYYEGTNQGATTEKWRMTLKSFSNAITKLKEADIANYLTSAESSGNNIIQFAGYKIAFSIWRNNVQISDWFPWYFDGSKLRVSEGLYLPGIQKIKYADLVSKVNSKALIPGRKYRIIDYVTTTSQRGTRSAGKLFDVVVTALTTSTLDENASCCTTDRDNNAVSSSEVSYWHPERWTIKYSLLTNSFYTWANVSTTGFTGIIYYMQDEYNNECFYDFKNIQYTQFYYNKRSFPDANTVLNWSSANLTGMCNVSSSYRYTFTKFQSGGYDSDNFTDGSLYGAATGNVIHLFKVNTYTVYYKLPFIILLFTQQCSNNSFIDCQNITLEAYHGGAYILASDWGILTNNNFNNCDNVYIMSGRMYKWKLFESSYTCIHLYGTYADTYDQWGSISYSCIATNSTVKVNYFYNARYIFVRGQSFQRNNFLSDTGQIRMVETTTTPVGYVIENTFLPGCYYLTLNCPWVMMCIFSANDKFLTLTYSDTASFANSMKNINVMGTNFGTSSAYKIVTVELGKDSVQNIVKDGSTTILV